MMTLKVCSWNAHSLDLAKEAYLFNYVIDEKIDVCGVCETWKDYNTSNYAGFYVFSLPTICNRRGLAIFSRVTAKLVKRYTFQDDDFACISILCKSILLMNVYIPNGSTVHGIRKFLELFEIAKLEFSQVIIFGDLNARLGVGKHESRNACGSFLLKRLDFGDLWTKTVLEPTFPKQQSVLDHFLFYGKFTISTLIVIGDSWQSDHRAIVGKFEGFRVVEQIRDSRLQSFKATNWEKVSKDVEFFIKDYCKNLDLNEQVLRLEEDLSRSVTKRSRLLSRKRVVPVHLDTDIKAILRRRCGLNKEGRAQIHKEIRTKMRSLKRSSWTEFCKRGWESNDGSQLWKMFNVSKSQVSKTFILEELEQKDDDDREASQLFATAHVLNPDIEKYLLTKIPERFQVVGVVDTPPTALADFEKILRKLPRKASTGPDLISNFLLRQAGPNLTKWLCDMVNSSIETGVIPTSWKTANVKALAKPSGGFRPISLISNLAKLTERVVLRYVMHHCREHNIIPTNQYASKGGTSVALQRLLDYVGVNQKVPAYCVFFDVRKAFDRVHIPTLMQLLDKYEFPTFLGRWIYQYLVNRSASVGQYGYELANGVPQGSVLGPVLFQIYVSQVLHDLGPVYAAAYADDFVIAFKNEELWFVEQTMNQALRCIHAATLRIGVELDAKKTKAMWLWKRRSNKAKLIPLWLGDRKLEYASTYKYLGVLLENRLSFNLFIQKKLKTVKERNKYVFRLAGLTKRPLRALWRGYVESYLMYGLPEIYKFLSNTTKDKCKAVYYASARKLANLPKFTDGSLALLEAGLVPLEDLIKHRLEKPVNERGKRVKLRAKGYIDFPHGPKSRHTETVYSRWRTDSLWTNHRKFKFKMKSDGKCRYCNHDAETGEHVLLHCPKVDAQKRLKYLTSVGKVYGLKNLREVDLRLACGFPIPPSRRQKHWTLARALTDFLDDIRFLV